MNGLLDQLDLTPQERRIVVVIAVIVFVVLNLLLVWPHFKDLARVRKDLDATRKTIRDWNEKISMDQETNGYKTQLHKLERQQGGGIVNQQVQLQRTVSDQALKTGVTVDEIRPAASTHPDTNKFYDEQSVKISFECQESQLVNFLFNVGNDPAMIRVHELNLKTADANRYRLKGDAILTANYAKQTTAPAPKPSSPSGKPPAGKPPSGTPPSGKPPVVAPKTVPGAKTIPVPKPPPNPRTAPGAQSARKNL
jgi:Tfp pilus assembly protein PilO